MGRALPEGMLMPAPHRRNKGDSLAQHIDTNSGARKVANDRDNLVASRTRKDAKWEAAASSLEQRAAQARTDYERGVNLSRFDRAVREGRAKPPIVVLTRARPARYWLGHCLDCSHEMWQYTSRARVPLCRSCRIKRSR